jgi:hypothetical protein
MSEEDFEVLEELIWRWKNHYKMLEVISQSNITKDQVDLWKNQIDLCFSGKIKSKL